MKKYFKESVFILSLCTAILAFESVGRAMDFDKEDTSCVTSTKTTRYPVLTIAEKEECKEASNVVVKYTGAVLFWIGEKLNLIM